MNSTAMLQACAERHLTDYCRPHGQRAFRVYDHLGDPHTLTPTDYFAPSLLDVPIKAEQVMVLFEAEGPGAELRHAMQRVLDATDVEQDRFLGQTNFDSPSEPWSLVDGAILASGHGVKGIKAVAVTKILHRKRPHLVPIFDCRVYSFYLGKAPPAGAYGDAPRRLWPLLHADLTANSGWLGNLAARYQTPDRRPLSLLRAADIIIWEHSTTGCSSTIDP